MPQAVDWLQKAHRVHPTDLSINLSLAWALGNSKPPQRAEALRYLTAGVALQPQEPAVHYNLGHALARLNRPADALSALQKAVELKPDFYQAHANLGQALSELGKPEEAIVACDTAIRLKPDLAEAHNNRGFALSKLGRQWEALDAYRTAAGLAPTHAQIQVNLGAVLGELGEVDQAVQAFQKARELHPTLASAHLNLGQALHVMGRSSEAENALTEAAKLAPNYAYVHQYRGELLRDLGRFAEAVAAFQLAATLAREGSPVAKSASEELHFCRQMGEWQAKLPRILSGQLQPKDNAERIAVAYCLMRTQHHEHAASLYRDSFTEDPALANDVARAHRVHAARAALRAATGLDGEKRLTEQRKAWFTQAVSWLTAHVELLNQNIQHTDADTRAAAMESLITLTWDPAFRSLRDPAFRTALTPDERDACEKLTAAIDAARESPHQRPE
jgi:superkiller protein 3